MDRNEEGSNALTLVVYGMTVKVERAEGLHVEKHGPQLTELVLFPVHE